MELKRNIDHNRVKPLDDECKSKEHRLTKGCTSLMYACQQGKTGTIVTELRNKVNIKRFFFVFCFPLLSVKCLSKEMGQSTQIELYMT